MKARRVKKLDPDGAAGRERRPDRRARGSTRCARSRPAALHPECADEQHDLRIAAKRLRYVLESTGFCFGDAGRHAPAAAPATSRACSATCTTAT